MRKLTSAELDERLNTHAKDNHLFIFALMKAATVAMAGLALVTIVGRAYLGQPKFLLLIFFWIVSLMATILTYNAASIFSNLLVNRVSRGDVLIPFIKTPIEFMLFGVLWASDTYPNLWHLWPLCFGMFALMSHLKLRHFMATMREDYYSEDMQPLLAKIKHQAQTVDMPGSLRGGIAFVVVGIVVDVLPRFSFVREWTPQFWKWVYNYSSDWQIILAIPAFLAMYGAFKTADIGRRDIFEHIEAVREEHPAIKLEVSSTLPSVKVQPPTGDTSKTPSPR